MTFEEVQALTVAVLQALVLVTCLLIPGRFLLRRAMAGFWGETAGFRKVGYALLGSTWVLVVVQSLVFILPAEVVILLCRLLAVASVLGAVGWLRRRLESPHRSPNFLLVVGLGLLLVAALWLTWRSPIPGSISAGYGDFASYYRVVDNLTRGHFPLTDFRVGDYTGEVYFLPTQYPLATLAAGFFQSVFTHNLHAFTTVCIVFGCFGVFLASGLLCEALPLDGTQGQLARLSAAGFALLVPEAPRHLLLGAASLPTLTCFLIVYDLWRPAPRHRLEHTMLLFLALFATALSRPEGLMFIALFAAARFAVVCVRFFVARSRSQQLGVVFLVLLVALGGVRSISTEALGKTVGFVYLHYSSEEGTFVYNVEEKGAAWYHVVHDNSRESVGLHRELTQLNVRCVEEVLEHPWAFSRWLLGRFYQLMEGGTALVLTLAMLALGFSRRLEHRLLVPVACVYLLALTVINPAFGSRHILPILTLLWVVAAVSLPAETFRRALAPLRRVAISPALLCLLPFLLFDLWATSEIRDQERTSTYMEIFTRLRPWVTPCTRIASDYPQLAATLLDVEAVGNSILGKTLEPLLGKYRPDYVLIDDTRRDMPFSYEDVREQVEEGRFGALGYQLLFESRPGQYLVLERVDPPVLPCGDR